MAAEYKHKRYFRVRQQGSEGGAATDGGSIRTFSSTADANTKIGFTSVWNTSSPTKAEELADSGQTLVVTYEFNSDSDQTAFKNAIDTAFVNDGDAHVWKPATDSDHVQHFKTEWLHADGSVSVTANLL